MMRLLAAEFKKITGVKWFAAILAVLLFASSLVCFFYVSDGERSAYTPDEAAAIKEFTYTYSNDPDGFSAFRQSCINARGAIMLSLNEEYETELESGADEKELDKKYEAIYKDPATFLTYLYSDKIDDASLIAAYERLNEVRSDFDTGVDMILRQSERNAAALRDEYGMAPDDPLYRYQIYAYSKYKTVSEKAVVGEEFVFGWDKLLSFSYGDIFLFFALILLVGTLYFVERNSGMASVLRTTKRGRTITALSKTGAVALLSVALTLIFSVLSFSVVGLRCGYSDPFASAQNVKALLLFPEVWSIGGFYCYFIFLKCLAAVAFTGMLSVLASLIVFEPVYYLSGASLLGVHFILGSAGIEKNKIFRLNVYSVCGVIPVTERLYIFQPVLNCFGYYLIAPVLCVLILIVSSAVSTVVGNHTFSTQYGKNAFALWIERIRHKSNKKHNGKRNKNYRRDVPLMRWEERKLTEQKSVVAVLIVLLLIHTGISTALRIQSAPDRQQRIYTKFILPEVVGQYSQNAEKYEWLLKIYTDPGNGMKYVEEAAASGIFSRNQSSQVADNAEFIYENNLTDGFIYSQDVYDKNTRLFADGYDPVLIDETGVLPVLTNRLTYPLYIAVLIVCILIWTIEYGGKSKNENFVNILRTAKNGRKKTFLSKLCAAAVISAVLSIGFNIIEFLILIVGRDLSCLNAPIYSVTAFADTEITLTIIQYVIIMYVCRVIISVLFAVFVSAVASLAKNLTVSFAAVAGTTLLPTLLYSSGLHSAGHVSFCDFFGVNGMILFSSDFHVFAVYAAVFTAVTAALTVISANTFI